MVQREQNQNNRAKDKYTVFNPIGEESEERRFLLEGSELKVGENKKKKSASFVGLEIDPKLNFKAQIEKQAKSKQGPVWASLGQKRNEQKRQTGNL